MRQERESAVDSSYKKCQIVQESCKIHARYLKYIYKNHALCIINQDPVRTLAIFRLSHHGQILCGSITNDLSEPYGDLGKILVRSRPNLTFKTSHELDKILVQFSCLTYLQTCMNTIILQQSLIISLWPNSCMLEPLQT